MQEDPPDDHEPVAELKTCKVADAAARDSGHTDQSVDPYGPDSEPPPRPTPALRVHLQGTFLLIVLLLAFWGILGWASPLISNAWSGPDGAIVARAPADRQDSSLLSMGFAELEALTPEEVAQLQTVLAALNFDPGSVDGILGNLTRSAVEDAKAAMGLPDVSDRRVLETLVSAVETLEEASDEPVTDTGAG